MRCCVSHVSQVIWNAGVLVAVCAEDTTYILKFNRDAYTAAVERDGEPGDEGVEEAFELIAEISDKYVFCAVIFEERSLIAAAASRPPSG